MNKREFTVCESLVEEALKKLEQAESELAESDALADTEKNTDSYIKMRSGDQHYGYAQGIYHALSALHYKSDKMTLLSKKL